MNTKSVIPYMIAGAAGALVSSVSPFLISPSQADTKLLPFQGRLTDAAGTAIADGAKVVEFKMYDAPTGGNVKWAGEIHKLSINGGLVNTLLGGKASLGSVDFSTPCYLQITVDANTDNQITAADPPLLPRQSVIAAVYASEAGNSRQLGAYPAASYQAVFANADPSTGQLEGSKIKPLTLPGSVLTADSITVNQIGESAVATSELADNSVTSAKIQDLAVSTSDLADNSVTFPKSPARPLSGATASLGQIARSADVPTTVNGLTTAVDLGSLTITTKGGPVFLGIINSENGSPSYLAYRELVAGVNSTASIRIVRGGSTQVRQSIGGDNIGSPDNGPGVLFIPVTSVWGIDDPPPGTHTYTVQSFVTTAGECSIQVVNGRLVAYEIR